MAHVQKFTRGSVAGLANHIERKTRNHSNEEIDNSRTKNNYDLCEKEGDMNKRLSARLSEVHCLKRENVKVIADWVVTLPEELKKASEDVQRQFFEKTYKFLAKRYGEKNVIASVVHNDETTPHMHFAFIPVVFDEKKQREKVSAKEVLNRKELQSFHQDLDICLKETMPEYQQGILNGETIGVETTAELKELSQKVEVLKAENQQLQQENKELRQEKRGLDDDVREVKEQRNRLYQLKKEEQEKHFERMRRFKVNEKEAEKSVKEAEEREKQAKINADRAEAEANTRLAKLKLFLEEQAEELYSRVLQWEDSLGILSLVSSWIKKNQGRELMDVVHEEIDNQTEELTEEPLIYLENDDWEL